MSKRITAVRVRSPRSPPSIVRPPPPPGILRAARSGEIRSRRMRCAHPCGVEACASRTPRPVRDHLLQRQEPCAHDESGDQAADPRGPRARRCRSTTRRAPARCRMRCSTSPIQSHVAAAHLRGRSIRGKRAARRHQQEQLAERQDDHAHHEGPEARAQCDTADAERIDNHAPRASMRRFGWRDSSA